MPTLLFPAFLLLLPLGAAGLVYAYRTYGIGPRKLVGSTFLLAKLIERTRARRKFKAPPLFFLEVIILLILTAAALGWMHRREVLRVGVLIDTSTSMLAEFDSETRIELALEKAREVISSLPSSSLVFVATTLDPLPQVGEGRAASQITIPSQLPIGGSDYIADKAAQFVSKLGLQKLYLITDRKLEAARSGVPVEVLLVGQPQPNWAIAAISLDRGTNQLQVSTRAFGSTSFGEATLTVEAREPSGAYRNVAQRTFSAADFTTAFPLGNDLAKAYRATLRPSGADAIARDNVAWLTTNLTASNTAIGFFSPFAPEPLGLKNISHLAFETITEEELRSPQLAKRFRGVLAYRAPAIPENLPVPLLGILSAIPGVAEFSGEPARSELTSWSSLHPLLKYADLELFGEQEMVFLTPGIGAVSLARGTRQTGGESETQVGKSGAVIVVNESLQQKSASIGFDLLPYRAKESPLRSILLLNALSWLSSSSGAGSQGGVGSILDVGLQGVVKTESGGEVPRLSGRPQSVKILEPGLYEIPGGELLAINELSQTESDTTEVPSLSLSPVVVDQEASVALKSLSPELSLVAALLFAAELLILLALRLRRRVS